MENPNVKAGNAIVFIAKEQEKLEFKPIRFMLGQGILFNNGEINDIGRLLDINKVCDVYSILSEILPYESGETDFLSISDEQLNILSDIFQQKDHSFCVEGISELKFCLKRNLEVGILIVNQTPLSAARFSFDKYQKDKGILTLLNYFMWIHDCSYQMALILLEQLLYDNKNTKSQ